MKTIIKKTEIDEVKEKVHHALDVTLTETNPKIANA